MSNHTPVPYRYFTCPKCNIMSIMVFYELDGVIHSCRHCYDWALYVHNIRENSLSLKEMNSCN